MNPVNTMPITTNTNTTTATTASKKAKDLLKQAKEKKDGEPIKLDNNNEINSSTTKTSKQPITILNNETLKKEPTINSFKEKLNMFNNLQKTNNTPATFNKVNSGNFANRMRELNQRRVENVAPIAITHSISEGFAADEENEEETKKDEQKEKLLQRFQSAKAMKKSEKTFQMKKSEKILKIAENLNANLYKNNPNNNNSNDNNNNEIKEREGTIWLNEYDDDIQKEINVVKKDFEEILLEKPYEKNKKKPMFKEFNVNV